MKRKELIWITFYSKSLHLAKSAKLKIEDFHL